MEDKLLVINEIFGLFERVFEKEIKKFKSMSMIAIIPARSGSKGVVNKNIINFGGFPLIAYSIAAAKMINEVERVIVSTDSVAYAKIANKFGAETPFIRPIEISDDRSTDYDLFEHALSWLESNENYNPEYVLHLRPTTPIRDKSVILDAISLFKKHPEASSLRSGHLASESPFKWFLKDKNGYFKGIRSDLTPEKINMARQTFPPTYISNGYVDILKADYIKNNKKLHGDKMLIFESPFCSQIDNKDDLEYLQFLINKEKYKIRDYLLKSQTNKK